MATPQERQLFRELVNSWLDNERAKTIVVKWRESWKINQWLEKLWVAPEAVSIETTEERITAFPSVSEGLSWQATEKSEVIDTVFEEVEDAKPDESQEWLKGFVSETWEALKTRWENLSEIQERLQDKRVSNREEIKRLADEWQLFASFIESAKWAANKFWSAFQTAWQLAWTAWDIIWEWIENTIQEFTPEQAEDFIEDTLWSVVNSNVWQSVVESYSAFRENNPELARNLEAVGNIGWLLASFSKWWSQIAKAWEKTKLAEEEVAKFIKPTKEKTKATTEKITPEFIEKLKSWEIKPWTQEEIQALAKARSKDFGLQINEAVEAWLEWTVNRNDLLDILDDLKQQWVVAWRVVDEEIVTATDKMADIISWFPESIPADKARELRQVFDSAVFKSKWPVTEEALALKSVIKKKLADNIRNQLSEQNPDFAKLNQEFSFYKNLDELLDGTLSRTAGQAEWGGLETKASTLRRQVWTWAGASAWGLVWWIPWAAIWGVVWASLANKIDNILTSPKYKLISAKKKAQLAEALVSWDKALVTKVVNEMAKKVWITELADEEQE